MSEKCTKITGVLQRNGTDQSQRTNEVLDPNSLELHGFGIPEWMEFAINFAKHVNYYGEDNSSTPSDDWQAFFAEFNDIEGLLSELDDSDELTPHLTLFICFLKLLELPKKRLNGITKRHLDFFYTEVLKIDKLKERSDSAFVLFELAKNFDQEKLEAGLQLDGGKDALGKQRAYTLDEELVANQAKVVQLKNVYKHFGTATSENPDVNYYFRSSPVANSYDGLGGAFPGDDESWLPFGYYQDEGTTSGTVPKLPILEKTKMGFSVSSPALNLSEGVRYVQFSIEFSSFLTTQFSNDDLVRNIKVYYTAKNTWIGPLGLYTSSSATESVTPFLDERIESVSQFSTYVKDNFVKLAVRLEPKDKATGGFNNLVHLGRYNTEDPIFKFVIDVNTEVGAKIHEELSKAIKGINIHVGVTGMKQLLLDSDTGTLNPTKPMYPFTQNPVKGSSLIINNSEIFSKKWSLINTDIKWKNTPDNFKEWYEAYQATASKSLSQNIYESSQKPPKGTSAGIVTNQSPGEAYIVTSDAYFKAKKFVMYNQAWESFSELVTLFVDVDSTSVNRFECSFGIRNSRPNGTDAGPIKLSLETPFFHQLYPQLYAIAMTSKLPTTIIPNPPYTPFADEIIVEYFAKESISFGENDAESFENRTIRLFHEHPFGQSDEHDYLKSKYKAKYTVCSLAPAYGKGGQLFIGLQNAQALQTVSLLIQLQEGSENPLAETFTVDSVTWEILCNDHWKELDSLSIIQNEVDNFLKSGLVKLKIPNEASTNNTQLDGNLHWIKAVMPKSFDAVCRVLDIQAQGARATFVNNENELSHLEHGIPAETISKLVERSSRVKGVLQPFTSFGGKLKENDELYYKRVSERLRHKNRAIMLWDYEHIILQAFSDIYKVKCLNHTNARSFLAAGCVTVVVIPDTKDKNMFNSFQPRVSTARLNEVKAHVQELTSLHVSLEVINPSYEEVKIYVDVKFHEGYDDALYKIQLDTDLKQFLSPWAFDSNLHVEFGITLHSSVLLNFIEKRYYVDHISNIKMSVDGGDFTKNCTPSSPKSILVSAEQHEINVVESNCPIAELTTREEC